MPLPIVDVFSTPCEIWSERDATIEEMTRAGPPFISRVKDKLVTTIRTPLEAVSHIAREGIDGRLAMFISAALTKSSEYHCWRDMMPSRTPISISTYQKSYPKYDAHAVGADISEHGAVLPKGQILFHGGKWWGNGNTAITTRPLSLTFCPQVAILNAVHNGKAYDAGQIDLFALTIQSCNTKAFVFRRAGTNLGHESEVLLSSGVTLSLRSRNVANSSYPLCKADDRIPGRTLNKQGYVYVLEVDVL